MPSLHFTCNIWDFFTYLVPNSIISYKKIWTDMRTKLIFIQVREILESKTYFQGQGIVREFENPTKIQWKLDKIDKSQWIWET